VRHGDTAWTLTAQHTGRTDLPLSEQGERQARELGASLTGLRFGRILSSPLQRARRTAELGSMRVKCLRTSRFRFEMGRGAPLSLRSHSNEIAASNL
jgi:broad specificity phosphatase PhoE